MERRTGAPTIEYFSFFLYFGIEHRPTPYGTSRYLWWWVLSHPFFLRFFFSSASVVSFFFFFFPYYIDYIVKSIDISFLSVFFFFLFYPVIRGFTWMQSPCSVWFSPSFFYLYKNSSLLNVLLSFKDAEKHLLWRATIFFLFCQTPENNRQFVHFPPPLSYNIPLGATGLIKTLTVMREIIEESVINHWNSIIQRRKKKNTIK